MTDRVPLVTIGIPTYNRSESLQHAIRSALAQDHPALEVVVSDDGSTDDTAAAIGALATDERLRCILQPVNLGHARNFQAVLEAARGEYFMWLSDDDWLDPTYVSRCLAALRGESDHVLTCGLARYHSGGRHVVDERPTDLLSRRPGARLLAYFARVNVNGALFGLARREDLCSIGFADEVGGDWRLVGALASRGRIRTLRDVHIHRSIEGFSSDPERLARSFGMRGPSARHHHVVVAARLAKEITTGSPAFAPLSALQRAVVAPLVALLIIVRFPGLAIVRRILRRLGFDHVEPLVTAWVRRRD